MIRARSRPRDVVVVGGGPAGAATARLLADRGLDVVVFDKARFPRDKACGEFLSPAATPILDRLGVREAIEAAGARRLRRVRIRVPGAPPLELGFPADTGVPPWGYALSRLRLDAILLDAARTAGAEVVEGVRVEGPLLTGDRVVGVRARTPHGRAEVGARIVVDAGGRNGPLAVGLGLQRRDRRRRYDLLARWRSVRLGSEPDLCELRVVGDGYVAAAPIEADRLNLNVVVSRAALRRETDPAHVYRTALLGAGLDGRVPGRLEGGLRASDVTPLVSTSAVVDGAMLVGDAALVLDPFTGQGIYLALAAASLAAPVVADALARGRCDREALAAYEIARREQLEPKRRVNRALLAILDRPRIARRVTGALDRSPRLASIIAAVTADMVPATEAWSPRFGLELLMEAARG